ncbi:MAG: hypothetical protein M3N02_01635 [Pseudomonadota bacterium]|nr:hypothetical protein [Pseudomonadota bacterium]
MARRVAQRLPEERELVDLVVRDEANWVACGGTQAPRHRRLCPVTVKLAQSPFGWLLLKGRLSERQMPRVSA